jgi:plastocyanin
MAVALVATALGLAACGSSGTATTTTSSGGGSAGKTATTTHSIVIRNFAFSPSTATVAAGSTVTVINEDQVAHTLTATKGGFTTGDIAAGTSKTFTAPKTPGTYTYICSIHQYMTGSLVVSG